MNFEKEVGYRIRKIRKSEGITLKELSSRAGITKSALSQIERGIITPSIVTFKSILDALGVSFSEFFEKEDKESFFVLRKSDYKYLDKEDIDLLLLTPFGSNKSFDILRIRIPPSTSTRVESPHDGEESGIVLRGAVYFYFGKKKLKIKRGETYLFYPDKPHFFENRSKNKPVVLLHIVSPPNIDVF